MDADEIYSLYADRQYWADTFYWASFGCRGEAAPIICSAAFFQFGVLGNSGCRLSSLAAIAGKLN